MTTNDVSAIHDDIRGIIGDLDAMLDGKIPIRPGEEVCHVDRQKLQALRERLQETLDEEE